MKKDLVNKSVLLLKNRSKDDVVEHNDVKDDQSVLVMGEKIDRVIEQRLDAAGIAVLL